ncbi:hypothetical protein [Paenibacillus sp. Soil787]|uniref:hypothetical protein n=1 Tax=Paenibacillus sp. Soil787 TaxID=1736411 RepID=UPI000702B300|nr:hypothetical protein [Paenibacillus sp. Soil787]KRF19433.1 hypothetical protein ASG93_32015 [Paenibacillus sp. Soil787]
MNWNEVRKLYPDRFVKLHILKSHIENQVRYIDDMAVIQAFDDEKEATRELVRSKDDVLVYHTGKEKIEIQIKQLFGFRGQYDKNRV